MKPIALKGKMALVLNKRTVAALNVYEMKLIGGNKDNLAAADSAETDTGSMLPPCNTFDTTNETGITPQPNVCAFPNETGGE